MVANSKVRVRVDHKTKAQASEVLSTMGLTISDAVRLLLKRIVAEQTLPIELKIPNARTRAAIEEARALTTLGAARPRRE
jgi:DNA-damage-inducible protein J